MYNLFLNPKPHDQRQWSNILFHHMLWPVPENTWTFCFMPGLVQNSKEHFTTCKCFKLLGTFWSDICLRQSDEKSKLTAFVAIMTQEHEGSDSLSADNPIDQSYYVFTSSSNSKEESFPYRLHILSRSLLSSVAVLSHTYQMQHCTFITENSLPVGFPVAEEKFNVPSGRKHLLHWGINYWCRRPKQKMLHLKKNIYI